MAIRVADLVAYLGADTSDFDAKMSAAGRTVEETASRATTGGLALAGFGSALAAGLGATVNASMNFGAEMNAVAAVTGVAGREFEELRGLALQLGKDTAFSASESAAAIGELAKAGVSVGDILGGAAAGATDLAAAAGVAVPQAATVMSNAMNIFGLAGDQATHIADVFAAASNKSAADVNELALALQASGNVAAQFGVGLEDTVGTLALFHDYGLRGSDAGTSLKTALLSLLDPTAKQQTVINELGLSLFDASGQFIGMAGLADQLRGTMAGLTEEQVNTNLAVLFGSDAVRAASILYRAGGATVHEYSTAVNQQGAAQEMAATRMRGLKGAFEQLRGSAETAGIVLGDALAPAVQTAAELATSAANAFLEFPRPMQQAIAVAAALTTGVVLLAAGLALAAPALGVLGAALGVLLSPIGLVAAAAAALAFVFRDEIAGGMKVAISVVSDIVDHFSLLRERGVSPLDAALRAIRHTFDETFGPDHPLTRFAEAAIPVVREVVGAVSGLVGYFAEVARTGDFMSETLGRVPETLRNLVTIIGGAVAAVSDFVRVLASGGGLADAWNAAVAVFGGGHLDRALAGVGGQLSGLVGVVVDAVGSVLGAVRTGFAPIDDILDGAIRAWDGLGQAVQAALGGDWQGALGGIKEVLLGIGEELLAVATLIPRSLMAIVQAIDWGEVGATLLESGKGAFGKLADAWEWLQETVGPRLDEFAGWALEQLGEAGSDLLDWGKRLFGQVDDALSWLGASLGPRLSSFALWALEQLGETGGDLLDWGKRLFGQLDEAVAWLGETVAPRLAGFALWAFEQLGDAGSQLLEWGQTLFGQLDEALAWVGTVVAPRLANFAAWAFEQLGEAGTDLLDWGRRLFGQLDEALGWLGQVVGPRLAAFAGWALEQLGETGSQLLDWGKRLFGQLDEAAAWLGATVGPRLAGFVAWALSQLGETGGDLLDWGKRLFGQLDEAVAWLGQAVGPRLVGFAGWALGQLGETGSQILDWGKRLFGQLDGAMSWLAGVIGPRLSGFGAWAAAQMGNLKTALLEKGRELMDGISTGVGAFSSSILVPRLTGFGGWVKEQIGSLKTVLLDTGRDLMQGLIDGIGQMGQGVADAVLGPINDAIGGAKRKLGIESPSRVFAEIGRNTIAGLLAGAASERRHATATYAALADDVAAAFGAPRLAATLGGPGRASGPSRLGLDAAGLGVGSPASGAPGVAAPTQATVVNHWTVHAEFGTGEDWDEFFADKQRQAGVSLGRA